MFLMISTSVHKERHCEDAPVGRDDAILVIFFIKEISHTHDASYTTAHRSLSYRPYS